MKDFFKSTKFKIIAVMLAFLAGLMVYSATSGAEDGESLIQMIFGPVQRFSTNIKTKVQSSLDMIWNAKQYYDENQKLKDEIGQLYSQIVDYNKVKRENEQLREIMGLKEEFPDYVFSPPCAVIARTTNDPYGSFVIDRGSSDGISKYDPVITANGLVGVVVKVSKTYSRVQTILSPEVPVGAYCVRTKDPGVVEGSVELAGKGRCKMMYIDRSSDIKKGDVIVTSGNSGLFPVDRVIGTVEEVGTEESGLSLYAIIKPAVDLDSITNVFVITDFNGKGEGYEND